MVSEAADLIMYSEHAHKLWMKISKAPRREKQIPKCQGKHPALNHKDEIVAFGNVYLAKFQGGWVCFNTIDIFLEYTT